MTDYGGVGRSDDGVADLEDLDVGIGDLVIVDEGVVSCGVKL